MSELTLEPVQKKGENAGNDYTVHSLTAKFAGETEGGIRCKFVATMYCTPSKQTKTLANFQNY